MGNDISVTHAGVVCRVAGIGAAYKEAPSLGISGDQNADALIVAVEVVVICIVALIRKVFGIAVAGRGDNGVRSSLEHCVNIRLFVLEIIVLIDTFHQIGNNACIVFIAGKRNGAQQHYSKKRADKKADYHQNRNLITLNASALLLRRSDGVGRRILLLWRLISHVIIHIHYHAFDYKGFLSSDLVLIHQN